MRASTGRTIYIILQRRIEIKQILRVNGDMNSGQYWRLMTLTSLELFCSIPVFSWFLWSDIAQSGVTPYNGWKDTHANFQDIGIFPASVWENFSNATVLRSGRWMCVLCGFLWFAFFGFASEARKNYRAAFQIVAKRIKFSSGTEKPNVVLRGDLNRPSFVRTKPNKIETTISTLSTTCDGPDTGSSLMDQINGQLAIPGIVEETEKNCSTSDTSSREIHHKTTTVTTTPPKAAGVQDTHGSTCSSLMNLTTSECPPHQSQRLSGSLAISIPITPVPQDASSPQRHDSDAPKSAHTGGKDDIV
jgi:hypothetical protein